MQHYTSEAQVIIRLIPGITFFVEGIQKYLYPDNLGVGRFIVIGISSAGFWAPIIGIVEIIFGALLILGGSLREIARLLSFFVCAGVFIKGFFNVKAL
jgi:uncharacterized membrane protein YphA (DoxX/SURF4 family)